MALSPGARLGPYEVLSAIGSGGMGEVYRARDTKLNRDVALKVLPASVANDPERLGRFRREAQVLASLNHPNIAHIHGLEDAGDTPALVMELVSGPTLADILLAKGPRPKAQETGTGRFGTWPSALGLPDVLAIARQIVDALEAAHAQHIVHRDLKPANLKVRDDGIVKVLDFGIAKVLESAASDDSGATMTAIDTQVGIVIGTPAYMSPEQARGAPVDERTDIWSFGCVLYEMLGGRRPFPGESSAQVVAAVLEREPDWKAIDGAPAALQRLVRRCLQKDPRRRLRDIGDARFDLEELQAGAGEPAPTGAPQRRQRPWFWLGAGLAAGLVAAAAIAYASWPRAEADRGRTDIQSQTVTDSVGMEEAPAISPDGKNVAFTAFSGRRRQIWVRLLEGGTARQITRDDRDADQPRWAPDSTTILYFTHPESSGEQGHLYEISIDGGQPRPIAPALGGADISRDGIVAFQLIEKLPALVVLGPSGSPVRELVRLPRGRGGTSPRWSPDGRSVAYIGGGGAFRFGINVVGANGGEVREFESEPDLRGLTWTPDGSGLIYGSPKGSTILYPPTFHLRLVRLSDGQSEQLTFGNDSYTDPDVSATSGLLLAARTASRSSLWRIPTTGTAAENARAALPLTNQTSQVQTPSASPDANEIAYLSDSGGHGNLWILDARGQREPRRITFEKTPDISIGVPVWSPNGSDIVHIVRTEDARSQEHLVRPDGTHLGLLLDGAVAAAWSPKGDWLYYTPVGAPPCIKKIRIADRTEQLVRCGNATAAMPSRDGTLFYQSQNPAPDGGLNYEIRKANPEDGAPTLLRPIAGRRLPYSSSFAVPTALSPDGKWLAYVEMDGPTANIRKISTGGGEPQPITDFGTRSLWIVRQISWGNNGFLFAAIADVDADIVSLAGLVSAAGKSGATTSDSRPAPAAR